MMDILAIALALIAGLQLIFSYGPSIDANSTSIQSGLASVHKEINYVKREVARVEQDGDKSVEEVKNKIEQLGKEGREDRQKIEGKIDQLILREMGKQ